MLKIASLVVLAQLNVPQAPPPDPILTPDEQAVVRSALEHLNDTAGKIDKKLRVGDVLDQVNQTPRVDGTMMPIVNMALSWAAWNLKDAKACALGKKLQPSFWGPLPNGACPQ